MSHGRATSSVSRPGRGDGDVFSRSVTFRARLLEKEVTVVFTRVNLLARASDLAAGCKQRDKYVVCCILGGRGGWVDSSRGFQKNLIREAVPLESKVKKINI